MVRLLFIAAVYICTTGKLWVLSIVVSGFFKETWIPSALLHLYIWIDQRLLTLDFSSSVQACGRKQGRGDKSKGSNRKASVVAGAPVQVVSVNYDGAYDLQLGSRTSGND